MNKNRKNLHVRTEPRTPKFRGGAGGDIFGSFEDFFRFYYPRLKKYAHYFLRNEEEAEDLVQDVFFQLWKDKKHLENDKSIPSYVFTLVKNRCLNTLKRRVVEEKYLLHQASLVSEELYHISFGESGEFISMEENLQLELDKLIAQMPEKCAIAFRLKWLEGKKIREIAEEMNISTTMVDKHLAKGIAIAKEKLSPGLFVLFLLLSPTKPQSAQKSKE